MDLLGSGVEVLREVIDRAFVEPAGSVTSYVVDDVSIVILSGWRSKVK